MTSRGGSSWFWSARFVSQLGNELSVLAVPFLLLARSDSDGAVGFVYAAEYLPFLLLAVSAGSVVNRVGIVRTMVAADLARFALFTLLALAPLHGDATVLVTVLVACTLAGAASACDGAAYRSLQPALGVASGETAVRTYARFEVAQTSAMVLGPLLAGGLVESLTPRGAIALDAATFAVSAVLVVRGAYRIGRHASTSSSLGRPPAAGAAGRTPARASLHEVRASAVAIIIVGGTAATTVAASAGYVVLIVFANRVLGLDAIEVGLVFTVAGCGALLGAVLSRRLDDARVERSFLVATVVGAVAAAVMPLAVAGTAGLTMLAVAQFVANVSGSVGRVGSIHLRQHRVSPRALPHLESLMGAAQYGMRALGALLGGVLAVGLGPRTALVVAVVANLVAVVAMVGALRARLGPSEDARPPAAAVS